MRGGSGKALGWLGFALLGLLTLALAVLTLGSFANLNPDAPLWLRSVGTLETLLTGQAGLGGTVGFARALSLTLLTSLFAALTASVKPRS